MRAAGWRGLLAAPQRPVLGVIGLGWVVAAWHVGVASGAIPVTTLPAPGSVAGRMPELVADAEFRAHVADTLATWALAMLTAGAVAIPLGLVLGYVPTLSRPASTVIHAARSVPSTALLPISVLFFGLGLAMKVALVSYAIFWPMALNSMYGVRAVDPQMVTVARSFGWGRYTILWRVILPSAASYAATGVRIAGGIALIVVLSAELLGASRGIGTVIVRYQQADRPDFVYAGILLVGMLGIAILTLLRSVERHLFPWAEARR